MRRFHAQNRNDRTRKKKSFFSSTYQSGGRADWTGLHHPTVRIVRWQSGGERTGKSLRNKLSVAIVRSVHPCLSWTAIDVNPKNAEQSELKPMTTWIT
jgi:hypothetical protein